jgi:plastocyanin
MRKTLLCLVIALAAVVAPAAGADVGHLVGTVGPGFTIDLADANGNHVSQVVAGRYEFLIHDLSDLHNFVLGDKTTSTRPFQTEVDFVGDMTFTVDLHAGFYAYACSPHFQIMNGQLRVLPATLAAQLSAKGAATLDSASTAPGTYTITVVDKSRTQAFRLIGPGVAQSSGKKFTGRTTWTVTLTSGTYRFGGTKLTGSLIVA